MNRAAPLSALCVALACTHSSDAPNLGRVRTTPTVRMTRTSPGVSLEVLDWGGSGPTLVFLTGLGNTAHVFDEFAPRFTDRYHVVGITRRGFGASSGSPPPNNLDTLVADISAVLDTLGLESVIIVGHSIAGEEMSRFAEVDGKRCAGLVYLDAAYDRTDKATIGQTLPSPPDPRMYAADSASPAAFRAFAARVMGVQEPESEIRAGSRFDANGRYMGEVASNAAKARVFAAVRQPRYDRIQCRSLAIYATPDSIADVYPYYAHFDATARAQADTVLRFVVSLIAISRARLERFPQNEVVEIHGGNHNIFLQRPDEVERAMRAFLSDKRPDTAP